jgi:hypothetical protein
MQLNLNPSGNHSIITIGGNTCMRKLTVEPKPLWLACYSTDSQVIVCRVVDVQVFSNAKDLLSSSSVDWNENKGVFFYMQLEAWKELQTTTTML